jgi:hypothetical protein
MEKNECEVTSNKSVKVKFYVEQHVRISKEKLKVAKAS